MATKNKKISAYLPETVYNCFNDFAKERKLSFSEATIKLFAEYFGVNLADSSTQETTGGLLDRITRLEQTVFDLSQKVDFIESTSKLPKSELNNNSVNTQSRLPSNPPDENLLSELPSKPKDELPIIKALNGQKSSSLNDGITPSELIGELPDSELITKHQDESIVSGNLLSEQNNGTPSVVPDQLEVVELGNNETSSPLNSLPSEPKATIQIKQSVLAQRLKISNQYLQNQKAKYSTEKFTEWITEKDPNNIKWQSIKNGRSIYYYPDRQLTDEQKVSLQKWLEENNAVVDSSSP